jgi:hypothetical protein
LGNVREAPQLALEAHVAPVRLVGEMDAARALLRVAGGDGIVVERAHPHPFEPEALHVDVGHAQFGFGVEAAGFREDLSEFVDRALAVPGKVGGALARPGRGVDIGGAAS